MAKYFVVLLASLLFTAVTTAADEQSCNSQDDLDLILQGFGDKPNSDKNRQELDDALQGFENQPQATVVVK